MASNLKIKFNMFRKQPFYQDIVYEILSHHAQVHAKNGACKVCRPLIYLADSSTAYPLNRITWLDNRTYAVSNGYYISLYSPNPQGPKHPYETRVSEGEAFVIQSAFRRFRARKKMYDALEYILRPDSNFMSFWPKGYTDHGVTFGIAINDHPSYRKREASSAEKRWSIQSTRRELETWYVPQSGLKGDKLSKRYLPTGACNRTVSL